MRVLPIFRKRCQTSKSFTNSLKQDAYRIAFFNIPQQRDFPKNRKTRRNSSSRPGEGVGMIGTSLQSQRDTDVTTSRHDRTSSEAVDVSAVQYRFAPRI